MACSVPHAQFIIYLIASHIPAPPALLLHLPFFFFSYTWRPPWISVWQQPDIQTSLSFHRASLFFSLSITGENHISFVWAALPATSGFPPIVHHFPPTFNGSLTSIFKVSCCSGQHFSFNYREWFLLKLAATSIVHPQSKNIVQHTNNFV